MITNVKELLEQLRWHIIKIGNEGSKIIIIPTIYYTLTRQWQFFEEFALWGAVFAATQITAGYILPMIKKYFLSKREG